MSDLPFKPLGDRVVIKADVEDHAPEQTDAGLYVAKTLTAAVEGSDVEDSWFVGTVVAIGPMVNRFDVRPYVLRELRDICQNGHRIWDGDMQEYFVDVTHLYMLERKIKVLPSDCPDPVRVGDRVTFSWASGQQIMVDGEKFLILHASDVLAVLEPESEAVA